ncbi:MAG: hypothetical protein ACD_5C00057G0001 [uncultured bacterium]|nr:MAG: hypothetical protein ACD_5C00057G0001 [uncultured bacterium]
MKSKLGSEIPKHFTVRSPRLTNRHIIWHSSAAPPIFLFFVVKDFTILHSVSFRKINIFSFNSKFCKFFFPKIHSFSVSSDSKFVVSAKNRDEKFLRIKPYFFGQKFKHPSNLLLFKIISKRPISKHFKKSRMAIITHFLYILRSETFL